MLGHCVDVVSHFFFFGGAASWDDDVFFLFMGLRGGGISLIICMELGNTGVYFA